MHFFYRRVVGIHFEDQCGDVGGDVFHVRYASYFGIWKENAEIETFEKQLHSKVYELNSMYRQRHVLHSNVRIPGIYGSIFKTDFDPIPSAPSLLASI